jgi:hypothetical protein
MRCGACHRKRIRAILAHSEAHKKLLAPSGKSPAYVQHRKNSKARAGNGRGLFRSNRAFRPCEGQTEEAIRSPSNEPKKFDTSGKSPAYLHHRKNFRARAGKLASGFFNRAGVSSFAKSKGMKQFSRRRTNQKI